MLERVRSVFCFSWIFLHSLPPPMKQKVTSGLDASCRAAASSVSSGCTGLWLPEYMTTNLPSRPCALRNRSRPSASNVTSVSWDQGGMTSTFAGAMPLATMRSRMNRSSARILRACRRLKREIQSSTLATGEWGRSHPAAMASSGLKSMTQ